jgi:glutamate synthase domain-containing protein 1
MYKQTVDIRQALNEANRLSELAKKKAEATKVEIVEPQVEKAVAEEVAEEIADNFIPDFDTVTDNRVTAIFKIKATPEDIEKVAQFLSINKIESERVG